MIYLLDPKYELLDHEEISVNFRGRSSRYIIRADSEDMARRMACSHSMQKIWIDRDKTNCINVPMTGTSIILAYEILPIE